jgi:hypothetical protein
LLWGGTRKKKKKKLKNENCDGNGGNKNQNNCLIYITQQTDKAEKNDDNARDFARWVAQNMEHKVCRIHFTATKHKLLPGVSENGFLPFFFPPSRTKSHNQRLINI